MMDGEKETAEEEEEELHPHHHIEAAASSVDCQGFPIMHWEDLSLWIAELEKQEQERRERSKVSYEDKAGGNVYQKTTFPMMLSVFTTSSDWQLRLHTHTYKLYILY